MAKTTPWSVKGIDDETRDIARAAARESGMTIGHWIDHAILSSTKKPASQGLSNLLSWRPKTGKLLPAIANAAPGKTLWGAAATLAVIVTAGLMTVLPLGPDQPGMEISTADAERVQSVAPAAGRWQDPPPVSKPAAKQSTSDTVVPQIASTGPEPVFEPKAAGTDGNTTPVVVKQARTAPLLKPAGIIEVQRLLGILQFTPGPPDGKLGGRTVAAIRLYQQFARLPVNGIADEDLLNDLKKIVGTMQAQAK